MKIHSAMLEVMRRIAEQGIAKLLKADLGGAKVNYRGIEQAMNKLSPILIACGVTVTPDYSELHVAERPKGDPKDAKATRFATVRGSFTFSAEDDSKVVATCYGEAMDSGDKAVTKAQSVAFRTALFQAFIVPTEATAIDPERDGDDDDGEDQEFITWQRVAMQGSKALRSYYDENVPRDEFWRKHQASLKADAKRADAEGAAK